MKLTNNEKEALLTIFKEFDKYYNSNSLSKKLNISRVGTMKILKRFEKNNILRSKKIGNSNIYKVNFDNDYARDLIAFMLSDEAHRFKRWKKEFKFLFKGDRIVLIYGSAIRNYSKANDIDLMLIGEKKTKEMKRNITKKRDILPKELHLIELSYDDFVSSLETGKESIKSIIRSGIVLYNQNKYVGLMNNVKSF